MATYYFILILGFQVSLLGGKTTLYASFLPFTTKTHLFVKHFEERINLWQRIENNLSLRLNYDNDYLHV